MWKQICACMYHSFWWSFLWFSLAFSGYYCSLVPGMFVCIEGQWAWPLPLVNDNGQMIASQLPLLPPVTPASLPLVSQDKWYCQYICKKRKKSCLLRRWRWCSYRSSKVKASQLHVPERHEANGAVALDTSVTIIICLLIANLLGELIIQNCVLQM